MFVEKISLEEAKKIPIGDLFQKLSSSEKGISTIEAGERLKEHGYNEIIEKKTNPILKFFKNFWGPIPGMIEIAAMLSAVVQNWEDFWIIISLLLLNAIISFWQEYKADNAVELLKKKLAPKSKVIRDGKWTEIPSKVLVPGDVVLVRLGDIVPADIKLVEGQFLLIDESALTGESLPVEKGSLDIAFNGSIIRQGEMTGLIISTGMNTYFGKTAKLIETAKTTPHFQKTIVKIGNYLIILAIILVSIIFITALIRHEDLIKILQFSLVLTVAAIPAALPAVLSVTMVIGAINLAKKEAIVRKLVVLDELAGVDVLFSDKTGTITKNELTIAEVTTFSEYSIQEVLLLATLASRAEDRDPIDDAIVAKTMPEHILETHSYKVIAFKPFDPVSKRTEVTIQDVDGSQFKVTKGAPQIILNLAFNRVLVAARVEQTILDFAAKGYRTLGVAKTDSQNNWEYVGLIAIHDPPREDSAETIQIARSMGIHVKMVTGDHIAIAKEISRQIDLGTNILQASSIMDKSPLDAQKIIEDVDGFAQVFPEHKYRLVELMQEKNCIVGMTGDGINDAPALKKADVGIAVAGASDAAKSAAEIVLTKKGISVIVDAIKEGRKIFQRMHNYAVYRIAETIRIIIFLTLCIILFDFYPISPVMIIFLAFLNDGPIMMMAYDNVNVSKKPVHWDMRELMASAFILGLIGVFSSFILFWMSENIFHLERSVISTLIFLKMLVAGHMTLYLARTEEHHFWTRPLPARSLFLITEITQIIGTIFAACGLFMTPIGWTLAAFIWIYSLSFFLINDQIKTILFTQFFRRKK